MRSRSPQGSVASRGSSAASSGRWSSIRCAVYTRKSTEEGLEQDFNSLHAQREACEAYIASQRHEGWTLIKTAYDDGGYSGGSMDRPGLQALLADIRSRLVDVVVVYKVDRLTRSLADFAKMVEAFDANGVSFVSVTQSFNTTSSMGRLTLNVLLSFAQFEREVTGERIRDKIAASKKKGLWMGGAVPMGFAADKRTLKIVEDDAATIRMIFERYLELGSVTLLSEELDRRAIRTNAFTSASGRLWGSRPFSRGHLYRILSNPIYVGEIAHKGDRYPGQHPAIIQRATFDAVQEQLAANTHERTIQSRATEPALLAGLLFDQRGDRLFSNHAAKQGRRYRYYVAKPVLQQQGAGMGADASQSDASLSASAALRQRGGRRLLRIPAGDIETLVLDGLAARLADRAWLTHEVLGPDITPAELDSATARAAELAEALQRPDAIRRRTALLAIVCRITVHRERVDIAVRVDAFSEQGVYGAEDEGRVERANDWSNGGEHLFGAEPARASRQQNRAIGAQGAAGNDLATPRDDDAPEIGEGRDPQFATGDQARTVVVSLPALFSPTDKALRHVSPPQSSAPPGRLDKALLKAIARGVVWYDALVKGEYPTIASLAATENVDEAYVRQRLKLAFLAPEIVTYALDGKPIGVDLAEIPRGFEPAAIWGEQWSAHIDADR